MTATTKVITIAAGIVVCAAIIHAYAEGPDPRHTGAPGDDQLACSSSGCHTGTKINGGGGSVAVSFPNGLTYTPGVQQTFTITITDSAAKVYGFQMTARLESNLANGQAGDFTAFDKQQFVICEDSSFKLSKGCPASAPVQFIEHDNPYQTNKISVKWTPPATNVGNVHIYVAANAANGNTVETGDHIYTANYTLTPQTGGGNTPTITTVQSAGAFNANAGLASGTWLEIYGTNLSSTMRGWGCDDFTNNCLTAPTSLDDVKVTIDGKLAYIDYISPTQVNVLAPDDPNVGAGIQVVLSNAGVQSNAITMQKSAIAPALLAPSSFIVNNKQYVVAQFPDQTFVGPTGLISGVNFRPAKPGDTIIIYGIGFGPVTPSVASGTVTTVQNSLLNMPTFRFGQAPAGVSYGGLAPNFVGLYQFNVVVPNVSPGDMQLNVDIGGTALNQTMFITVSQ